MDRVIGAPTGDLVLKSGTGKVFCNGQELAGGGPGGGGASGKTYIANPSATADLTGWVAVGNLVISKTTTASELPREHTTASGIKIVATADVQSAADYVHYDFSLDDVDLNRKLRLAFAQKPVGTYADGQLGIYIAAQSDRAVALYVPAASSIRLLARDLETSFDALGTAAVSLVIHATADMVAGDGVVISDVLVGPGIPAATAYDPSAQVAGTIVPFAGAAAPAGWALCDGAELLITSYEQLYARIGSTWNTCTNPLTGSAWGAPTSGYFRLPDLRGTFLRGAGDFSDNTKDTVLGGFQADQNQSHTHTDSGHTHAQTIRSGFNIAWISDPATQSVASDTPPQTGTGYANIQSSGGSETRPQNVGVNYLIKLYDAVPMYVGEIQNAARRTKWVDGTVVTIGSPSGASNISGMFQAESDSLGRWFVEFFVSSELPLSDAATFLFSLSGLTFAGNSPVTACEGYWGIFGQAYTNVGANTISIMNDFTKTWNAVYFHGKAEVTGKPTWADAYMETNQWQPVGFGSATTTSAGLVDTQPQSFAGVKNFPDGITFDVTKLSNQQATALGLKQYKHGASYNGGNSPTISYEGAGSINAVTFSSFRPKQLQDGTWILDFNFMVFLSLEWRTSSIIRIEGVVTDGSGYQIVNATDTNITTSSYMDSASGAIHIQHTGFTTSGYQVQGSISLASKPIWAY